MIVVGKGIMIPRDHLRKFSVPMRIDRDELSFKELVQDIQENGIQDDLIVRATEEPEYFEILDGHRRYEATGVLGWTAEPLPCDIRVMTDEEAWPFALKVNVLRSELGPASIGNFTLLMRTKFGWSQETAGKMVGKSQSWISRHEKFIQDKVLPPGTREAQARALRAAPEMVRQEVIQEAKETGEIPTAKEIKIRAEKKVERVIQHLDYSRHDEEYARSLFVAEGFTPEEARDLAVKWDRRELAPRSSTPKLNLPDRRNETVRTYEQLVLWYPTEIIDVAESISKSRGLESLRKNCRRYASGLHELAPPELRAKVKERFVL